FPARSSSCWHLCQSQTANRWQGDRDSIRRHLRTASSSQPLPTKPAIVVISVPSTNPSTGSGAMLWRAGAGGTDLPKEPAMIVMSVPSEKLSLLTSAGQALVPQWLVKFVPADVSTAELKPSQSGSLVASGQGGRFCAVLCQLGQL